MTRIVGSRKLRSSKKVESLQVVLGLRVASWKNIIIYYGGKKRPFFPYFHNGIIFYCTELLDCAFNLKFCLNISTFLKINTNQTSKEQDLNFNKSSREQDNCLQDNYLETIVPQTITPRIIAFPPKKIIAPKVLDASPCNWCCSNNFCCKFFGSFFIARPSLFKEKFSYWRAQSHFNWLENKKPKINCFFFHEWSPLQRWNLKVFQ